MTPPFRILRIGVAFSLAFAAARAQVLKLTPLHASGIYALGEKAGWSVEGRDGPATGECSYTLKKNNATLIASGKIDLAAGRGKIEAAVDEAAMLYLEVVAPDGKRQVAGAAVAPEKLQPTASRPADFDAFWEAKLKLLRAIPPAPVVTPGESGKPDVEYATVRLNSIGGAHVYGQLAKPAREGKFPAVLIMQWAGAAYPLQKQWVTDRAAEGWLAFNIEPHDVPGDMPAAFYAALPAMIKNYASVYNDDRDRNYFLQMYLGDVRAMDYLASRPDWNGKVLVAMGTSMGGQQSFAVAGLHSQVTHLIVHVPAGADSNAALHGRYPGYPNWDSRNPKIMSTALYFDTVNFASRIHATCLVSMGFLDNVCPAVGVWTAFNQIPGRKEAVPLVDAAHNHQSTAEQQRPYTERSTAWLASLARGEEPALQ